MVIWDSDLPKEPSAELTWSHAVFTGIHSEARGFGGAELELSMEVESVCNSCKVVLVKLLASACCRELTIFAMVEPELKVSRLWSLLALTNFADHLQLQLQLPCIIQNKTHNLEIKTRWRIRTQRCDITCTTAVDYPLHDATMPCDSPRQI